MQVTNKKKGKEHIKFDLIGLTTGFEQIYNSIASHLKFFLLLDYFADDTVVLVSYSKEDKNCKGK